jgi:Predicted transcriptional regulators
MSSEQPKRLAEKLRQIREHFSHTREVMAGHLDVSGEDIDSYEAGSTVPPLPILLHYARFGYTRVENLIDDELPARPGFMNTDHGLGEMRDALDKIAVYRSLPDEDWTALKEMKARLQNFAERAEKACSEKATKMSRSIPTPPPLKFKKP